MGIRNSIIAFFILLFTAIPALAAPVSFTLRCDANHPNDDVVIDQVWQWDNNQVTIITTAPHPPPVIINGVIIEEPYDWTTAYVEFPITIERRVLSRAVFMAVAVDSNGYTSVGNTNNNQIIECNTENWTTGWCLGIREDFESYDKDDLGDSYWACWEEQQCIDDYLKAKKLTIRLEEGP